MKKLLTVLCLILSITILSCDKNLTENKTGTVSGVAMTDEGQVVTVVKLDDGTEIKAVSMPDSGMVTVTGGQRVEVEPPAKDSELWKVVRVLETAAVDSSSAEVDSSSTMEQ